MMPQNAAKKKPPGGRRVGKAEVERRLRFVESLLVRGHARREIVAELSRQFGASTRTADDYIRRVRDEWQKEADATASHRRAEARARLMRLRLTLEGEQAWTAIVSVERLLADLDGLRVQPSVQLTSQPHEGHGLGSLGFKTAEGVRERITELRTRFADAGIDMASLLPRPS